MLIIERDWLIKLGERFNYPLLEFLPFTKKGGGYNWAPCLYLKERIQDRNSEPVKGQATFTVYINLKQHFIWF